MKHTAMKCLGALALSYAAVAAGADSAATRAGTFDSVSGTVQVERGSDAVPAAKGSEVNAGDIASVGAGADAMLRTADNAVFELGSDTDFKIVDYAYAGSGSASESRAPGVAKYELKRGVVRTITGTIGKQRGDNYLLTATEADVRVHGTDYSAQRAKGLLVVVYSGSVTVSNDSGSIELAANEYVFVGARTSKLLKHQLGGEIQFDIPFLIRVPSPIPVSPS